MAFGVAEGLEGRHLHIVRAFGVVGAGSAVADLGAGRGKEQLGAFDAGNRGQGRDRHP